MLKDTLCLKRFTCQNLLLVDDLSFKPRLGQYTSLQIRAPNQVYPSQYCILPDSTVGLLSVDNYITEGGHLLGDKAMTIATGKELWSARLALSSACSSGHCHCLVLWKIRLQNCQQDAQRASDKRCGDKVVCEDLQKLVYAVPDKAACSGD